MGIWWDLATAREQAGPAPSDPCRTGFVPLGCRPCLPHVGRMSWCPPVSGGNACHQFLDVSALGFILRGEEGWAGLQGCLLFQKLAGKSHACGFPTLLAVGPGQMFQDFQNIEFHGRVLLSGLRFRALHPLKSRWGHWRRAQERIHLKESGNHAELVSGVKMSRPGVAGLVYSVPTAGRRVDWFQRGNRKHPNLQRFSRLANGFPSVVSLEPRSMGRSRPWIFEGFVISSEWTRGDFPAAGFLESCPDFIGGGRSPEPNPVSGCSQIRGGSVGFFGTPQLRGLRITHSVTSTSRRLSS